MIAAAGEKEKYSKIPQPEPKFIFQLRLVFTFTSVQDSPTTQMNSNSSTDEIILGLYAVTPPIPPTPPPMDGRKKLIVMEVPSIQVGSQGLKRQLMINRFLKKCSTEVVRTLNS